MPKFKFATETNGGKPFEQFIRERYDEKMISLGFEFLPGNEGPTKFTVTYRKMRRVDKPLDIMFSGSSTKIFSRGQSHSAVVYRIENPKDRDCYPGKICCWNFEQLDRALDIELDDFTNFGDFCRKEMGIQSQYGSRYIDGRIPGYPNLGKGLRFEGKPYDYHFVKIHRQDRTEFLRRYKEYDWDRSRMSHLNLAKKYEIQEKDD
jgi:hypothetical protein